MNTLCAFSSDSRELYKADIYRVLALPTDHIVHFRYKKKYVDDNILSDLRSIKKQKVAIFFTHGNEEIGSSKNIYTHFSVRWATVSHFEISKETDVFHLYMRLGDFCNVALDSGNSIEKQVPDKFFSLLSCTEINSKNNWQSRITVLQEYFPEITFFHLKEVRNWWRKKTIHCKNDKKFSYYNLNHGDRYTLKMAVANPKNSDTKIEITDSSEEITINCINPLETSIQFDDYDIPISVKTLQVLKQASLLQFKPKKVVGDLEKYFGEYATNIELNLKLSLTRPLIFGFFSTLAFWALLLAKPLSKTAVWPSTTLMIVSTLMFFVSSSSLFFWFNKK